MMTKARLLLMTLKHEVRLPVRIRAGTIVLVAIALLPSTLTAAMQSTKVHARPSFEALDRNRDGKISRTEAGVNRTLSNRFAYVDLSGDGFIDAQEYALQSLL